MAKQEDIRISLTLEGIYNVLCSKCKEKFLELAAQEGVTQAQESAKKEMVAKLKEQFNKEK